MCVCVCMYVESHDDVFTIYRKLQKYKSFVFIWCLLMLKIDISFNLFMKDCTFVTTTIPNIDTKEAWLLVLVGHMHDSPPLALRSNLNPHEFLYLMPHPPTHLCIKNHLYCPLYIFFHIHFFTSNIQWQNNSNCQSICCLYHSRFLTFIIHGTSVLLFASNISEIPQLFRMICASINLNYRLLMSMCSWLQLWHAN